MKLIEIAKVRTQSVDFVVAAPDLMNRSGSVPLAAEFGVLDVDGRQPLPLTLDSV